MPKSYNNLFAQIANFANLYAAWEAARRGKRRRPGWTTTIPIGTVL